MTTIPHASMWTDPELCSRLGGWSGHVPVPAQSELLRESPHGWLPLTLLAS